LPQKKESAKPPNGAVTQFPPKRLNSVIVDVNANSTYGSYAMTLDAAERLTQETDPFGLTVTYTNDPNGNVTQESDSAGGTVTSVYDSANRLTSRSFSETGAALRIELTYNAQNEVTTEKRYNAATGGALVGQTTQGYCLPRLDRPFRSRWPGTFFRFVVNHLSQGVPNEDE
jgi:YD repeat-containing protein